MQELGWRQSSLSTINDVSPSFLQLHHAKSSSCKHGFQYTWAYNLSVLGADSFCHILFHLPLIGWPSSDILHLDLPYKSHDCQGDNAFCLMLVVAGVSCLTLILLACTGWRCWHTDCKLVLVL
jgi:hypothetical protein